MPFRGNSHSFLALQASKRTSSCILLSIYNNTCLRVYCEGLCSEYFPWKHLRHIHRKILTFHIHIPHTLCIYVILKQNTSILHCIFQFFILSLIFDFLIFHRSSNHSKRSHDLPFIAVQVWVSGSLSFMNFLLLIGAEMHCCENMSLKWEIFYNKTLLVNITPRSTS